MRAAELCTNAEMRCLGAESECVKNFEDLGVQPPHGASVIPRLIPMIPYRCAATGPVKLQQD